MPSALLPPSPVIKNLHWQSRWCLMLIRLQHGWLSLESYSLCRPQVAQFCRDGTILWSSPTLLLLNLNWWQPASQHHNKLLQHHMLMVCIEKYLGWWPMNVRCLLTKDPVHNTHLSKINHLFFFTISYICS